MTANRGARGPRSTLSASRSESVYTGPVASPPLDEEQVRDLAA
jgi:hypothetical protein